VRIHYFILSLTLKSFFVELRCQQCFSCVRGASVFAKRSRANYGVADCFVFGISQTTLPLKNSIRLSHGFVVWRKIPLSPKFTEKLTKITYLFLHEKSLCLQIGFEVFNRNDGIPDKCALTVRFLRMLSNQVF
jgi:hypothetical protein